MISSRWIHLAPAIALVGLALQACGGGTAPPPRAGESTGFVPDLSGVRVMVFPVQSGAGVPGDADAELGFALESRAPAVEWILPDELRRAAASSPGYDVEVDDLPVRIFRQAEVRRVGDPLYGYLRRLAALVDADAALIPVLVRYRSAPAGDTVAAEGAAAVDTSAVPEPGRVEVTAALLSVVSGRVIWSGVAGGSAGLPSDPAALASALDALARRMGPPAVR